MEDLTNGTFNNFFKEQSSQEVIYNPSNSYITSKVYAETGTDIVFIKVDLPTLGFYINSISVRENPRDPDKLWVQMPKFKAGARWISPLEFRTDSPLRELIIKYALRAYYCHFYDNNEDDILQFIDDNFP